MTLSSASYEDPNAVFAGFSRETGIGVFVKAGDIEFSHLASEPVPYTPPRRYSPPLEKIMLGFIFLHRKKASIIPIAILTGSKKLCQLK